jgi:hypothetical protein
MKTLLYLSASMPIYLPIYGQSKNKDSNISGYGRAEKADL